MLTEEKSLLHMNMFWTCYPLIGTHHVLILCFLSLKISTAWQWTFIGTFYCVFIKLCHLLININFVCIQCLKMIIIGRVGAAVFFLIESTVTLCCLYFSLARLHFIEKIYRKVTSCTFPKDVIFELSS